MLRDIKDTAQQLYMSNDEGHQRHRKDLHYYLNKIKNKIIM